MGRDVSKREEGSEASDWPSAECVKFEMPEAENTYKKAIMRFKDAVLMEKTPDRVPIFSTWTLDDSDGYGFCYKSSVFDTSKKPGFDFHMFTWNRFSIMFLKKLRRTGLKEDNGPESSGLAF
jgi:hypothetical protein